MNRDLAKLHAAPHDVLIIGGGIYGAAMAREAASRGLKTALVEQADFCSGSSANSLKIIHGGLRYLQQADLPRVLESIRERSILLRIAPHLASPVPCLMPTRGRGMKSRAVMACGMWVNDMISINRNRNLDPLRYIPDGGTLTRQECLEIVPHLESTRTTGAAQWYDGLAFDTERLAISMLKAAARSGAHVANYVKVQSLCLDGNRVTGARVEDRLGGEEFDIRASIVVNAAGPWIEQLLGTLDRPLAKPPPHLAMAMNLVIKNWPVSSHALGLPSALKQRLYFFMPWHGAVMAGTYYREHKGSPDTLAVTEEDIQSYLRALNTCLPGVSISHDDILAIHLGIVPSLQPARADEEPALLRHYHLTDHAKSDGIEGLLSICGVKFTTARGVAEQVVNAIAAKTGLSVARSATHRTALPGGDIADLATFQHDMANAHPSIPDETLDRLLALYGTEAREIFKLASTLTGPDSLLRAELLLAIRNEMPQKLGDLVFRRTAIASAGLPYASVLRTCGETMAGELGWSPERLRNEIAAVEKVHHLWQAGCLPSA